jgi:hypothetical protein
MKMNKFTELQEAIIHQALMLMVENPNSKDFSDLGSDEEVYKAMVEIGHKINANIELDLFDVGIRI